MDTEITYEGFSDSMLDCVKKTYCRGKQITFDGYVHKENDLGVLLEATMSYAVTQLREKLFCVWPRARELTYATIQWVRRSTLTNLSSAETADKTTSTDLVCTKEFKCRCWERGATMAEGKTPSGDCKGTLHVMVVNAVGYKGNVHVVQVKFTHR